MKQQEKTWGQLGSYCWWFRNPANQVRLVVYRMICRVSYIQVGAGFEPWTVGFVISKDHDLQQSDAAMKIHCRSIGNMSSDCWYFSRWLRMFDDWSLIEYFPLGIQVCPKKGISQTNPMTWGWDVSTINPTRESKGSGILGFNILATCRWCQWTNTEVGAWTNPSEKIWVK